MNQELLDHKYDLGIIKGAEAERNRIRAIAEGMKTPLDGTLWNDLIDDLVQRIKGGDSAQKDL